ncbi:MAG: hypothetical protein K2X01_05775 [Cyanobacteria bacterium]|nr:hypothetical protein [Cyanobacteriota bacterium]
MGPYTKQPKSTLQPVFDGLQLLWIFFYLMILPFVWLCITEWVGFVVFKNVFYDTDCVQIGLFILSALISGVLSRIPIDEGLLNQRSLAYFIAACLSIAQFVCLIWVEINHIQLHGILSLLPSHFASFDLLPQSLPAMLNPWIIGLPIGYFTGMTFSDWFTIRPSV